ncbi:MAG: hypothetical protein ACHQII_02710, partial [Bacteroidia bacterium]
KKIRKKRNFIVHSLDLLAELHGSKIEKDKKLKIIDCWDAFVVITKLFKEEYNIDLELSGSYSYSYGPSFWK